MQHEHQRLQRLAEAHVVGQTSAAGPVGEAGYPAEAVELIGSQVGLHPIGKRRLECDGLVHARRVRQPLGRRLDVDARLRELLDERHRQRARDDLAADLAREARERGERLAKLVAELDEARVVQLDEALVVAQRAQ